MVRKNPELDYDRAVVKVNRNRRLNIERYTINGVLVNWDKIEQVFR